MGDSLTISKLLDRHNIVTFTRSKLDNLIVDRIQVGYHPKLYNINRAHTPGDIKLARVDVLASGIYTMLNELEENLIG